MDTQSKILDFVKAMSDPDRLRIIGALSQGPLPAAKIAETSGLPFREAFNHLAFLEYVGVVIVHAATKKQDEIYELDSVVLEQMARQQFEGKQAAYVPPPDKEEQTRRVLTTHLNPDGSIRHIPNSRTQAAKFRIILDYVICAFENNKIYTEREVNAILKRYNEDTAGLRRDLVEAGLLGRERDGSKYWRCPAPVKEGPE